jgi:hypothetical protein
MKPFRPIIAIVAGVTLVLSATAQTPPPPPQPAAGQPAPRSAQAAPGAKSFSQQELEQLVAPIALYPDALLAQVLMASTYPLEVVRPTAGEGQCGAQGQGARGRAAAATVGSQRQIAHRLSRRCSR